MTGNGNETMGRILARAWSDAEFKRRLRTDPRTALTELGIPVPRDMQIAVVENTAKATHLVLGAPRRVEPLSGIYDVKRFGETYRDPRLHTLNWVSHDPVHTARIKEDPVKALAEMGLHVPEGMTVTVVENTWTLTHLVLPPQPAAGVLDNTTMKHLKAGRFGPTLGLAALLGPIDYRLFVRTA